MAEVHVQLLQCGLCALFLLPFGVADGALGRLRGAFSDSTFLCLTVLNGISDYIENLARLAALFGGVRAAYS